MVERVLRSRAEQLAGYRRVLEARDPTTPADRLRILAADEIRPVRVWTGLNPHAPPDALELLAHDEDNYVRRIALHHPSAPETALLHIPPFETAKAGTSHFMDRETIAHHPNASRALRKAMISEGTCRARSECRHTKSMWRIRRRRLTL
ncbi:hypothetical protein [Actinomadura sp. 3N508]|uniref:hypothetical protein n=1 Tax=Actinomadura sp. 3N508 TaxID=3375153 RepID=UPI003787FBC0